MSDQKSLQGLNCPDCGGMIPIPEGQKIVRCPFCNLRSYVKGERGLLRYQVPLLLNENAARNKLRDFLVSHDAIEKKVARNADIIECFVAYLPFWTRWSQVLGWVFGEEAVQSGDSTRYEPCEIMIAQEMNWNEAACDVGEFGVTSLPLTTQKFEVFDPAILHASGMVFEPVGSLSDVKEKSSKDFNRRVKKEAYQVDRVAQVFTRFTQSRLGIVYYPLWVLRYLYHDRAFQVVVDGHEGNVLYGKAPGSNIHRARVLVLGMAAGAFVAVDVSVLCAVVGLDDGSFEFLLVALGAVAAGFGIMANAYRKFRYGELFEYRESPTGKKRKTQNKLLDFL
jgi:hypothetical protein